MMAFVASCFALVFRKFWSRHCRRRSGRCMFCGYDLRGHIHEPHLPCSECGAKRVQFRFQRLILLSSGMGAALSVVFLAIQIKHASVIWFRSQSPAPAVGTSSGFSSAASKMFAEARMAVRRDWQTWPEEYDASVRSPMVRAGQPEDGPFRRATRRENTLRRVAVSGDGVEDELSAVFLPCLARCDLRWGDAGRGELATRLLPPLLDTLSLRVIVESIEVGGRPLDIESRNESWLLPGVRGNSTASGSRLGDPSGGMFAGAAIDYNIVLKTAASEDDLSLEPAPVVVIWRVEVVDNGKSIVTGRVKNTFIQQGRKRDRY